jgi:hypothetical protein
MTDTPRREPDEIGVPADEHEPGRPTGATDADGLRGGQDHADAPTEAPEERGKTPSTEHAPGGDL